MSELSTQELEEVAKVYEKLLAPALFEIWIDQLVDAAAIMPGQKVLDVACGTGVLARAVDARVGRHGSVSGLDINPGMLAAANRIAPGIDWREGSAEDLPYADGSFDAVVSQFGLMLFSAPVIALREMWRVLKPEGHLAVAVFDSIDNLPAYAAMADVYERLVGKSVADALRFPFSMGDTDQLASLSAAAGMSNAQISTVEETARFSGARNMVLSDVKGWFPFAGFHLDEQMIDSVVREAEKTLEPFQTAGGAVEFRVSAHVISTIKT
jgi:ubiquinone/menaquinone biosynthesis C-methylase UbiE